MSDIEIRSHLDYHYSGELVLAVSKEQATHGGASIVYRTYAGDEISIRLISLAEMKRLSEALVETVNQIRETATWLEVDD